MRWMLASSLWLVALRLVRTICNAVNVTHTSCSVSTMSPPQVPLGTDRPTREELDTYYPPKFTWTQLKTFINSGDLGLLKRDRALQERYDKWTEGIRTEYGSSVNYLKSYRLQWGKPDKLSLLPSSLSLPEPVAESASDAKPPPYFTADAPGSYISIIQNDWPYSVPSDVEHWLIWTTLPIFPPIPGAIAARVAQDGLWGFTGSLSPPPSPSTLPACLPSLAEWGVTLESMVVSPSANTEEQALLADAAREIDTFVGRTWAENKWETAWFVNPPRLQSVPDLAHIHVFARRKKC